MPTRIARNLINYALMETMDITLFPILLNLSDAVLFSPSMTGRPLQK